MNTNKLLQLQTELHAQMRDGDLLDKACGQAKHYLAHSYDRHVAPSREAVEALAGFNESLPESRGDPTAIIEQLHTIGSAGTVCQLGGRFFGLVNGSLMPTALAARITADSWDQNAVLYATSPVNAVIEQNCERWLKQLFGLPDTTVAGFVSGTSMALLCGLAAARWRLYEKLGTDINEVGLAGAPKLRIVTGRHAHSTVIKAIALLGFGTQNIEWVEVDDNGCLIADQLPELDSRTLLILQAGNVNSGGYDPIRHCCELANAAGAWTHIDGAFGLWAAASSTLSHLTDGLELAQSWSVDAHKTLNVPYDNGISLCVDEQAMTHALQNSGAYIVRSEQRDGLLYTPEMSRRARAIDLWATLKYLGREGVDVLVTGLHHQAQHMARAMTQAGFKVVNQVVFNQVIVQLDNPATTSAFTSHVQQSGEAWVGTSEWFEAPVIRISVCSWATAETDIQRTVAAFEAARSAICK